MISKFLTAAKTALPELKILYNEPLSKHTSFRIGGPAEVMVFPSNIEELSVCRKLLSEFKIEPRFLGAGSNVLAPDDGICGVVICLKDNFECIRFLTDHRMEVYAGATLGKTAVAARNAGLSGMEFAHGIPGTVGGGVYMNAGAYGGELCQITESVTVMKADGTLYDVICDDKTFGYRTSVFENSDLLIVKAVFRLEPGTTEEIQEKMTDLINRRCASQPLDYPSAGSTFKRPAQGYAAALIDEAGLKGLRVGDACVSEKHAGFVINLGNATAADVCSLMEEIQSTVYEKSGIMLCPEVRIW